MKHGNRKRWIAMLAACVMTISTVPALSLDASATNIISNSTFTSGTSGWSTYKESGGSCSLSTEDGQLALTVSSVGKLNYSVQVCYDIIPLYQNGVYRLKYDISSSIDRTVEGMIQQNGGTYQAYTWKKLELTSTPQTVDYTFTMTEETDIMAKMVFNCGTQGEDLPEHTIYLDNVSLELVDDSEVDYSAIKPYESPIVTDQMGYKTTAEKTAVVRLSEDIWDCDDVKICSVVNADTGDVVYTGSPSDPVINASADEYDAIFDFSSVTTPGNYYIICNDAEDASYTFTIGDDIYDDLLDDTVRMFYLQRCGTAITDTTFSHVACHTTDAVIYGTDETIDVSGGWHDAGDYGRYVVAGAKAVADLLYAYDANPALYSDSVGIPESGNGVPDILDETRYELEWMLKMQASSGGVYHKVTCESFPGYVMPEKETAQLIVTPVSTTATADFCAVMAMASEFYQAIDPTFAATCLEAAEKAWDFLEENPNLIYQNPSDITTGDYGDTSDKDERYWAAAQMYRATGESEYLTALEAMTTKTGLDWSTVGDYGNIAILTMDGVDTTSTLYSKIKSSVVTQADKFLKNANKSAYDVAITSFNWGSNMTVANAGIILGLAYQLTGDDSYLTTATSQLHYLLGNNPVGECFVTGYGTVSPENPHHRPSMAKGQAMKGMLVGGVDSSLEDSAAKAYLFDTPSAKRYVDNSESYSTNEITIYWNSPLIYLLSLTEDSNVKGDVNADNAFDIADVVMMQKYLLQDGTLTNWENGDFVADRTINVMDLLLMKRALLKEDTIDDGASDGNANSIVDYGTAMNTDATMVADFTSGSSSLFFASNGWSNGSCFDCVWRSTNAVIKDAALQLTIDEDASDDYNYSGAEYRSTDFYSYGYYETSMQAIKNDGVDSSFFTYTGPSDNNPWDEIDIEILGKDTTKVQFNYYTNGVGNHEYLYDLGFDASAGYHTYGFDWQPDSITWYVDGVAVYTASNNIPSTAGKIMMNVWPGTGVDSWLNAYDGTTPLTARYQWVTYNES
jgi:endoglucanase